MHMYMYMYMHNNYNSTHVHIHACTYMCIQVWVQARYIICDICGSCKQVGAAYIGYLGLSCFPLLALHLYNALSLPADLVPNRVVDRTALSNSPQAFYWLKLCHIYECVGDVILVMFFYPFILVWLLRLCTACTSLIRAAQFIVLTLQCTTCVIFSMCFAIKAFQYSTLALSNTWCVCVYMCVLGNLDWVPKNHYFVLTMWSHDQLTRLTQSLVINTVAWKIPQPC